MEDKTLELDLKKEREVKKVVKEQEDIPGRNLSLLLKKTKTKTKLMANAWNKRNAPTLKCIYLAC